MSSTYVPYPTVPADVVNQAIDSVGESGQIIGDINDGTTVSEAARRAYGQLLRQLLRANHWPFARKMAPLTLLGDATGASSLPVISDVETPWSYAYAWPLDGVQGRWLPAGVPPITPPGFPVQGAASPLLTSLLPARFLVSSSNLYPLQTGVIDWDALMDLQRTEGVGPSTRKVILTDVQNALFVYTRLVTTIEEWDDLFRQAMVALMAIAVIPTLIDDPKRRLAEKSAAIAIAKSTIADARAAASNEAGFPQSVDFEASFIRARSYGRGRFWGGVSGVGGYGYDMMGWDTFSFGGSVF